MNPGCAQGSSAHRLPVSTESFNCWRIKVRRILLSVSFVCVCVWVSRRVTCWEELFRSARGSYFTSLCVMCVRSSELLWHSLVSLLHQGCSMFTSVKAFEGQQYSTLKRQCLQSGLLFEDPRFPAIDDSLFYQGNRIGRVVWKRPRVSWFVQFQLMKTHIFLWFEAADRPKIFSMEVSSWHNDSVVNKEYVYQHSWGRPECLGLNDDAWALIFFMFQIIK